MYDLFANLFEQENTLKDREKMFNPVEVYNMMGLGTLTEEYIKMYQSI